MVQRVSKPLRRGDADMTLKTLPVTKAMFFVAGTSDGFRCCDHLHVGQSNARKCAASKGQGWTTYALDEWKMIQRKRAQLRYGL